MLLFFENYFLYFALAVLLVGLIFLGLKHKNYLSFRLKGLAPELKHQKWEDEYNAIRSEERKQLNELLDKIANNGMDRLSPEEHERLDHLSRSNKL